MNFMRKCDRWVVALTLTLVLIGGSGYSAPAQLTRGLVSGTITDPSGAILAGVQVTITNKATSISRETLSNEAGLYRFAALEPGNYTIEFKEPGFETHKVDVISVSTAQEVTVNQALTVGGLTTEVVVTEVPGAELAKTTATIERTFSSTLVQDLPLFISSPSTSGVRDVTRLALFAPNVARAPGQNGFSANGQRGRSNDFTLDGTDNNDYAVTLDAARVTPEAIAEIQVQTSAYSAEFGRNSGAQFSIVTRSGTNQYHGEGWEFYRGNGMEPVSLSNKRAGIYNTPRFDVNEFGGDVGGPIINNRTFFFGLLDWNRRREAPDARNAQSANIPTPSGYAALQTIPLASGQTQASRQAVLSALSFLPEIYPRIARYDNLKNDFFINGTPVQIGTVLIPLPKPYNFFSNTVRIDHKLSTKDSLAYRYYIDKRDQPNLTGNLQFGSMWGANQEILHQNHAFSYTRIISPKFLNESRLAYIRGNLRFPENDPVSPTVTLSNFFTIGGLSAFPQGRLDYSWQYQDVISATTGRHAMKFGLDIRRYRLLNQQDGNSKGTWVFPGLTEFINNQATSLTQALTTQSFVATEWDHAYFFQDDFRAGRHLTLNLGLRYQYASVPLGLFGTTDPTIQAAGVPGPANADKTNWAPRIGFAYSPGGSGLFGNGRTVVRGGFGVQYDVIFYNVLTNEAGNYPRVVNAVKNSPDTFNLFPTLAAKVTTIPPFSPALNFVNSPVDTKHPATDLWSLSVQRELGREYILEVGYSGNRSYHQIRQTQANPPVLTTAQAATVIANGNANIIPGTQARRLNPNWGARTLVESTAKGAYHAGYVKFERRMAKGLMIGANYTYSGTWSDNDELITGITDITNSSSAVPGDFFNYRKEWSRSAFDRPHRFNITYVYQIPWFRSGWVSEALAKILSGWQMSGITEAQSGQPFTITTGVDTTGSGSAGARPNLNPGGILMPNYSLTPGGPVKQGFSGGLRTFYIPTDGTGIVSAPLGPNGILANSMPGGGNLGRNTFRGPGFAEWSFSLSKSVKLRENMQFQIRSDFVNIWNHRNFPNPVTSMSSTSFGQNTAPLVGDAVRTILLNARLKF
jgi:outer membrane receptor protein involved in Fe transport